MNTAAQQVLQHAIAQRDPDGMLSALDMGANPYQGSSDTPSPIEQLVNDPQQVLYLSAPGSVGDKYKAAATRMLSMVPGSHQELVSVQRAALSAYRQLSAQRTTAHVVGTQAQSLGQAVPTSVRAGLDNSVAALSTLVGVVEQSTAFKCLQQEQGLGQVQQLVRQAQTTGAQEGVEFASAAFQPSNTSPTSPTLSSTPTLGAPTLGALDSDTPSYDRYASQVPKLTIARVRAHRQSAPHTQPLQTPSAHTH